MAGSDHSSVKVVLTAVFANFFVTIAKVIGWFISLSPSMLAEAIHSFADTSNQILIYVGIRSSRGGPTKEHPFGKGQSRYLWNLISAAGIFFIGFGVTTYHGVHSLLEPHHGDYSIGMTTIGILIFTFVVEFYAWYVAYRAVNADLEGRSYYQYLRYGDDPTAVGVFLEDSIAVVGVVIASIGIGLSSYLNSHVPDGIASIIIGLLIGVMAVILTLANSRLLIDASIPQSDEEEIKEFINSHQTIKNLVSMKTEILSPNRVRLSAEVAFNEDEILDEEVIRSAGLSIEDKSIENENVLRELSVKQIAMVARHVNELEQQIFQRFPDIVTIDLEVK